MGKIVFVKGLILVRSKYFAPKEIGVGYLEPPEGTSVVIDPQDEIDGIKCLVIDDKHPQSLFNEYYSMGGSASEVLETSYLTASYLDSIFEYRKRIGEICVVVKKVFDWNLPERRLVYKMSYVNILTSLDAFICYVLLKRSLEDENLFKEMMFALAPTKKKRWQTLIENGLDGEWEQDAIHYVQETSFLNIERIDKAFKQLKFDRIDYDRKDMEHYFLMRHLLVHRSGRQRDDTDVEISYDVLAKLVNASHTLVGAIFDSTCITHEREMRNKPPERDLEEIFPGGIVRAPFKLSDLARLLRRDDEVKALEGIDLPVL